MPRLLGRSAAVLAAVTVVVLGLAQPASAHVTVSSAAAVQGGFAKLTFRVPNEKATAQTVQLEIFLPTDAPVASVSLKPVPGWTAATERTTLATPITAHGREISEVVSKITWTAGDGAAIQAGQFQEFDVSMGPLPEVDQMIFKALQTYSDGDIVRWIEEPAGGSEPEHPAPVLKLAKAGGAGAPPDAAPAPSEGSDGLAVGLGVAGLVAGLAGLVVGLLAYRRTPVAAPTPAPTRHHPRPIMTLRS